MMRKKGSCLCHGSYKMARRSRTGRRADGICPPWTTDVYQHSRGMQYAIYIYCVYIVFSPQSNDSVIHDRGCSATQRYYRSPTHTRHRTRIFSSPPPIPPSLPLSIVLSRPLMLFRILRRFPSPRDQGRGGCSRHDPFRRAGAAATAARRPARDVGSRDSTRSYFRERCVREGQRPAVCPH